MASASDPSTMTRDELEERVADLEEELQGTKARLDAYDAKFDRLLTVVLGERELAEDDVVSGASLYEQVVHGEAGGSRDGFSEAARNKMLPAHRMAVDIRHGHEERIKTDKSKRAAELFRRMMHKVSDGGEPQPGVDNSGGTVTIQSKAAGEIILEFDDGLDSAPSATVTRAFRELQRLTKRDDCDCDSIDNCHHGLVMFQAGATNKVVANTARLIDYLGELDDLQTAEDDGGDADDGDHAPEATADETFDALDAAEPAGTANDVVSSNERTALGAQNGHGSGDNHES